MPAVCENVTKTMANIIKYWDLIAKDETHLLWLKDGASLNVDTAPKKISVDGIEYSSVAALYVGGFVFGICELFNYLQESDIDYKYIIVDDIKNKVSKRLRIVLYLRDGEMLTDELYNSMSRILKRTEYECNWRAIDEMGRVEKSAEYRNMIHMLTGKLEPHSKSSASLPTLSRSEVIDQTALDFCSTALLGRPSFIYVNGKLLGLSGNIDRSKMPAYSMVSRISGIGVAFAEEAYGANNQIVDTHVGLYIEVPTDDKLWPYYNFCVQELVDISEAQGRL